MRGVAGEKAQFPALVAISKGWVAEVVCSLHLCYLADPARLSTLNSVTPGQNNLGSYQDWVGMADPRSFPGEAVLAAQG